MTLGFILFSTAALSLPAARNLAQVIEAFAIAARRFGADPKAPPLAEHGPCELRAAAAAFNAMQNQIRRFVTDRTIMLAAISHDLRTPLTRMRLRGGFIDDPDQQARLFRDVAEMQAVIDGALALFNDEVTEKRPTNFDLSELIRLIVDDLADQGRTVSFEGSDHVTHHGRPFTLKRAIGNIVEMHASTQGLRRSASTSSSTVACSRSAIGDREYRSVAGDGILDLLPSGAFAQPEYRRSRPGSDIGKHDRSCACW